ncbi:MAG: peptidylprolyl isomerase [Chloroflexi bacterium]|nr:peptidylprolyl isomerase [Chloroflexota bacterium]
MSLDSNLRYVATIITNKGSIEIELFPKEAPKTVNNFVTLSKNGFYDEVIFHRVIPNFMIQGGDPTGTGSGGPGYTFEDEFHAALKFDQPGLLAMANSGPNTNGSQFFITTVPTPHLNGAHTIFGRVLEGQDVVEAISRVPTSAGDRPVLDVKIQGIQIEET